SSPEQRDLRGELLELVEGSCVSRCSPAPSSSSSRFFSGVSGDAAFGVGGSRGGRRSRCESGEDHSRRKYAQGYDRRRAHLRPFAAPPLVFREERVHGEVTVLSPPLYVRGPPKGFPFSRWRPKRQVASTATSSNTTTTTSTARPTTPDRVHGEVIVQTSFISVGRPAKGQESRSRKTRDVSDEPRNEGNIVNNF
ncbi:unnamed protein product, partial [Nesidiocoris tenuis]